MFSACHCGKNVRTVACTIETYNVSVFECGQICSKDLDCGNHKCQDLCHPGPCQPCQLKPDLILSCPCGKTSLEKIYERDGVEPRKSCLDEIPSCGLVCGKKFTCGPVGKNHTCEATCHSGKCPTCPLTTDVRCRCGFMDKEIPCKNLIKL